MLLRAVADVEHMYGVVLDGEEDAVYVVARTVEELADFLGEMFVFGSQRTTGGKLIQGVDGFGDARKPPRGGLRGVVMFPEICRLDLPLRLAVE
jgi:hypothetical protein